MRDMILYDILSRIKSDDSDTDGLIVIAFNYLENKPPAYNYLCYMASWGSGDQYWTRGLTSRNTSTANLCICTFEAFIAIFHHFCH